MPAITTMKSKIKLLHLSDVHLHDPGTVSSGNPRGNDPAVVKAFIEKHFTGKPDIDLILITGDIFDGQYANAKEMTTDAMRTYARPFFEKLTTICPPERIVFCYGNHDLNLTFRASKQNDQISRFLFADRNELRLKPFLDAFYKFSNAGALIQQQLLSPPMEKQERIDVSRVLGDYRSFIQPFLDTPGLIQDGISLQQLEPILFDNMHGYLMSLPEPQNSEEFFTFGVKHFEELNLAIAVVNTSWQNVNSDSLDGKLSLGKYQVDKIEKEIHNICSQEPYKHTYVVTLMHNAFNSLGYLDVHNFETVDGSLISRISKFSDLILCGHEHGELPPSLMHLETYLIKTGGLLNRDKESPRNSFSLLELDFAKRELNRHLYVYEASQQDFVPLKLMRKELPISNYYQFELYPKKAQKYFVAQQRDVEDFLEFSKTFKIDYAAPGSILVGKLDIGEKYGEAQNESVSSGEFFRAKDKIARKCIKAVLKETVMDQLY